MNCDACVGVEAEHHLCDQCVQDDITAERVLRSKLKTLTTVKALLARQRADIRRLRKATMALMVDVVGKFGAVACVDARLAVINALAPKRRARK